MIVFVGIPGNMAWLSYVRKFLIFLLHQFAGTLGTAILAAFALVSLAEAIQIFHLASSEHWAYWILTETPYYPVQIALAFYLGWVLWKRFPSQSAHYIWLLPLVLLALAFTMRTTLTQQWTSVLQFPRKDVSPFSHYFGWGCQPAAHCIDRLVVTMPFYASVSYSIATKICELVRRRSNSPNDQKLV